ncbi:LysR family transcriptional regulator [Pseudoalteromonas shioyasakiensis]|uniref:LysR family transcriptional regulator n=1 Tax=Pseudoalteromonas shioyasakiensis TaxID=1190813 RepID=UPI002551D9A1|nr:LysR family transcriptional regulator [Pseudoalteromonas shioyasakiensis]MDK9684333.1 LysR family transcriptional regulator [Pseudoalteromonas shioyasakiensis]
MDIDALRTFCAFVDTGSFTRAAAQICRTQSAVSMQMKKLEQDLASPLFEKQGRQLVLSHQGHQLASYAKQLIALHDEAFKQLKAGTGNIRVRIGCPDDYAHSLLPELVDALHQQFNALDLQISCAPSTELRAKLDQGMLDLVIATRSPDSEEGYLLQSSQGVWVKSPAFEINDSTPLPIALFQRDCKFHQASIEGLLKAERRFNIIACCGSAGALHGLIKQGLAIGSMARISMQSGVEEICGTSLPVLPVIDIVLLYGNHAHNPLSHEQLKQLVDLIKT